VHGHAGEQVALGNAACARGQRLHRGPPASCQPSLKQQRQRQATRSVHGTKPSCWARKAWSASLRTPCGGASTRWPMFWPSRPRSAMRAPPGCGAVPATTRSWGAPGPVARKGRQGCAEAVGGCREYLRRWGVDGCDRGRKAGHRFLLQVGMSRTVLFH
jgi:hypothetical protein